MGPFTFGLLNSVAEVVEGLLTFESLGGAGVNVSSGAFIAPPVCPSRVRHSFWLEGCFASMVDCGVKCLPGCMGRHRRGTHSALLD